MTWKRKPVVLTICWLVSLAIANYVGGVIGFGQGYGTHAALVATDAVGTVGVLRLLRAGRSTEAVSALERHLDSQIVSDVFGQHAYYSPYNLWLRTIFGSVPVKGDAFLLSEVLKYREEFPPMTGNADLNSRMMEKLAVHRNAPNPMTRK